MATATATKKKTARRTSAPRRDVNQEVTDRIIEAMEAGTLPWRPQYCVTEGDQLPTNQLTGKAYRGVNVMLLWIAAGMGDFNGNRWMTYKQAEGLGAQVRRGEKGTRIVYYGQIGEKNEESAKQEDKKTGRFYLKGYTVFNVAQIDGLDLPEFDPNDRLEFEPEEAAEKVVDGFFDREGAPTLHYRQCTPCYVPALDAVKMPPRKAWDNGPAFYHTLFHELVHATGHLNRLNRPGIAAVDRSDKEKYAAEEMVAELGASLVSAQIGHADQTVDHAASYIADWLKIMRKDSRFFLKAASAAQRAADLVLGQTPGGQA